jgi:hypothetical protein
MKTVSQSLASEPLISVNFICTCRKNKFDRQARAVKAYDQDGALAYFAFGVNPPQCYTLNYSFFDKIFTWKTFHLFLSTKVQKNDARKPSSLSGWIRTVTKGKLADFNPLPCTPSRLQSWRSAASYNSAGFWPNSPGQLYDWASWAHVFLLGT